MVVIRGVKVVVTTNGEEMAEFKSEADGDKLMLRPYQATRYIQSTTNNKFQVKCSTVSPKFNQIHRVEGVQFKLDIDGYAMDNRIIAERFESEAVFKGRLSVDAKRQRILEGFRFSDVILDESSTQYDATRFLEKEPVQSYGTITVTVRRIRKIQDQTDDDGYVPQANLSTREMIPKKAWVTGLEGDPLFHQLRLGKARIIKSPEVVECDFHDTEERPFAVFTFKYQLRTGLQLLGLIPRDPMPPVPLERHPINELSADEMRKILKDQQDNLIANRVQSMRESRTKMQQKRALDNDESMEPRHNKRREKKRRIDLTDVIDLTQEDDSEEGVRSDSETLQASSEAEVIVAQAPTPPQHREKLKKITQPPPDNRPREKTSHTSKAKSKDGKNRHSNTTYRKKLFPTKSSLASRPSCPRGTGKI